MEILITKTIYNISNAITWKESFSFIDSLSVDYLIKSDYPQLFFTKHISGYSFIYFDLNYFPERCEI